MTTRNADDYPDDTPLTQVRLATQIEDLATLLPSGTLPGTCLNAARHIEPLVADSAGNDKTLQILRDADLNGEGPAVAAARRAKKRQSDSIASAQHNAAKKICVRDLQTTFASESLNGPRGREPRLTFSDLPTNNPDNSEEASRARVVERLQKLWCDESCGIPIRWQIKTFDARSASTYLNLCLSYLEKECRAQASFSSIALKNAVERFERDDAQSLLQNVQRLKASSDVSHEQGRGNAGQRKALLRTGRFVSSRRARCPSDQEQILGSSGVEFPPFPGSDRRPGAMPQKVFEYLTAQADNANNEKTYSAATFKKPNGVLPAERDLDPSEATDEATQAVSASQWPESPDYAARKTAETNASPSRESSPSSCIPSSFSSVDDTSITKVNPRAPQLPPDSSQIQTSQTPEQGSSANTSPKVSSSRGDTHNLLEYNATPKEQLRKSGRRGRRAAGLHSTDLASSDEIELEAARVNSVTCLNLKSKPPSRLEFGQKGHRLIEVARTPFPSRLGHRLPEDDPKSTFVPSTYREIVKHNTTTDQSETCAGGKVPATAPFNSDRDEHHDGDKPRSQNAKRVLSKSSAEELSSTQYARKLEETREWRRSVLKPISKGNPDHGKDQMTRSGMQDRDGESKDAPSSTVAMRTTNAHSEQTWATPSLVQSEQPQVNRTAKTTPPPPNSSYRTTGFARELHELFRRSYGDYNGTLKQFEVACRLLAKHSTTARLHSFLLDDFVFHYAQSYAPYLGQCHDLGEDPLPYIEYFDSIEPTHFEKVVTVSDLHTKPPMQPNTQLNQSKADQHARSPRVGQLHRFAEIADIGHQHQLTASETSARNGISAPASCLDASQKSSVEEWLEKTVSKRAPSPELGTQGIDRSTEQSPVSPGQTCKVLNTERAVENAKGSPPAINNHPRLDIAPALASPALQARVAKSASRPHVSLTRAPVHSIAVPEKRPTLPAKSTPVRRSLPASFFSMAMSRDVVPSASLPASIAKSSNLLAKPAPIPRTEFKARAQATSSSQLKAKAPTSSLTEHSSSGRKSLGSDWWQDESTPFKRFASLWMKLPPENAGSSGP